MSRLNPEVRVGRERLVMLTQQLGAVQTASLFAPVAPLEDRRAELLGALDTSGV